MLSKNNQMVSLTDLETGEKVRVTGYMRTCKIYRKRLMAFGLTKGACFTFIRRAPLGSPVEINIRGALLSLRLKEAEILLLERV